jgi:hypothetical protein
MGTHALRIKVDATPTSSSSLRANSPTAYHAEYLGELNYKAISQIEVSWAIGGTHKQGRRKIRIQSTDGFSEKRILRRRECV